MTNLSEGVTALARLDLVVSCVPGSAGLTLPDAVLRERAPIVLDAAYRPRETVVSSAQTDAAAAAAGLLLDCCVAAAGRLLGG